ncbi:Midnolin Midbrain nucleolar protein [Takifugu flavidus]|uniref:Midnolin Midbrain nucleolar protein n=1 Tax=Takifugu flavidus TaxID=433684 RepID=A0A5C6MWG4_9TELE|nr:Midnolin Midbrain nucleolar protein [Takifugu flavidus]
MPKLGKQTAARQSSARSFTVFATVIGYRMDQHPSARSCTSRGASSCEAVPTEPSMNLYIHSTTGTRFELSLPQEETVEGLKRRLSQKLKVPKERLALLHKETRLSSGKLQDLGISDGSKLTLVPTVEAGLMSQASRPEQSVMQALESLTETQDKDNEELLSPRLFGHNRSGALCSCNLASLITSRRGPLAPLSHRPRSKPPPCGTRSSVNDFLSGRSPLTLALRVGDHMMFVQLQLAAQQSGGPQLQHRHLITRGNAEATAGQPAGHPRVLHHHPHSHPHQPHNPHSHHGSHLPQPHLLPASPTSPGSRSFPLPSAHHQPLPPMYHQSSTHCSPPTPPPVPPHSLRPSHVPGSLFRSPAHHQHHLHQPSTSQTSHDVGQAGPIAPVICPEANCSTSSASGGSGPSTRSRKPGAIIESFVNHAPGVFSGTFSGKMTFIAALSEIFKHGRLQRKASVYEKLRV